MNVVQGLTDLDEELAEGLLRDQLTIPRLHPPPGRRSSGMRLWRTYIFTNLGVTFHE